MSATLDEVRDGWDSAAQQDAMGHILTTGSPWNEEAFFAHGRQEIAECLARLDELDLRSGRTKRALDFGCGVGRLTQALADHYDRVDGVDIASSMLEQAKTHNRHGQRVEYAATGEHLHYRAGTFDLVYSMLVLQHMPQRFGHRYIRDFIRMLHPKGLAVFEIPDGPDVVHPVSCLSMYATPRAVVERIVKDAGGEVVDVERLPVESQWDCNRYAARRA